MKRIKKITISVIVLIAILFVMCFLFHGNIKNFLFKFPVYLEQALASNESLDVSTENEQLDSICPISANRQDFNLYSDDDFANFRAIQTLGFKSNYIYRGSSPIDNTYGRASYSASALERNQIHNIINLCNTENEAKQFPQFLGSYYSKQNVCYAPLSDDWRSSQNVENIKKIFDFIQSCDGPIFIHCSDGCDKTGFVCALLSSLKASGFDYIKADYYQSYYSLRKIADTNNLGHEKNLIDSKFRKLLASAFNTTPHIILSANLNQYAKQYLRYCGVSDSEIGSISEKLS